MKHEGLTRAVGPLAGIGMVILATACSGNDPKPMAQPTPEQVRGHADRGFDKLKQEEQQRGTQTNVPR